MRLVVIWCALLSTLLEGCGGGTGTSIPPTIGFNTLPTASKNVGGSSLLYVLSADTSGPSIEAFHSTDNGNISPLLRLSGPHTGLVNPLGIAVGPTGEVYVAENGTESVNVYAPRPNGDTAPTFALNCGGSIFNGPYRLAIADNVMYVSNSASSGTLSNSILIFGLPAACGSLNGAITGSNTELQQPRGIAVNKEGTIFSVNPQDDGSITAFAPGVFNNVAPRSVISGPDTLLRNANGIAMDRHCNIYVVTDHDNILVFAPGSSGDAKPVRTITGPHTGLSRPTGVAVSKAGLIYVANFAGNNVTVYGAAANGDASPIQTIGGSNAAFNAVFDVALSEP